MDALPKLYTRIVYFQNYVNIVVIVVGLKSQYAVFHNQSITVTRFNNLEGHCHTRDRKRTNGSIFLTETLQIRNYLHIFNFIHAKCNLSIDVMLCLFRSGAAQFHLVLSCFRENQFNYYSI